MLSIAYTQYFTQTVTDIKLKTFGHQFGFADFPYTNINTLFHSVYT